MQITVFGLFWLSILAISCIRGQNALIKSILLSTLFQAGAVVIIGDKGIAPLTISCLVFVGYSIFVRGFKLRITVPSFFKCYMLFIVIILISSAIASFAFNGLVYMEAKDWVSYAVYDGHIALFGIFTLTIYGLSLLFVYNSKGLNLAEVDRLLNFMVVFVFIVGVWHYCTVLNYIPRNDFIRDFIYSNSTTTDNIAYFVDTNPALRIYSSLFGIRFCGPFMEPSYCAGFLAMSFAYYMCKEKMKTKDIVLIILILLMAVMTYSATAYASIAFAGVLSAISSGQTKQLMKIVRRGIVLIVIALVVITYFDLWDAIERLIINKSSTHSAYIRGLWNTNAFGTMLDTIGIGLGYANVRGSSLLFTLPASCGILGSITFSYYIWGLYKSGRRFTLTNNSQVKFQIMLLTTVFSMIAAISVLDYSIFWMSCMLVVIKKCNNDFDLIKKDFGGN